MRMQIRDLESLSNDEILSFYPTDFFTSRRRFRETIAALDATHGTTLTTLPVESSGNYFPEPLTIDIATIGDPTAKRTLLSISATHGIEGFMGSAIQYASLRALATPPQGYSIVCIHALNPWGMAMRRRCNAGNVDLNRNCVLDPADRRTGHEAYEGLRTLLHPTQTVPFQSFALRAVASIVQKGFSKVKQAAAGGQYIDPDGIFYGGESLAPELIALREWATSFFANHEQLLTIDLHSGLGRFGDDVLILDDGDGSTPFQRVVRLFPSESVRGPNPATSVSYETRGSLSHLIPSCCHIPIVDHIVHEFGTYHAIRVLHALITENQGYHLLNDDSQESAAAYHQTRDNLFEMFCPASPTWRVNAVKRGVHVFEVAKRGLQ
jgi:hypothetical protein